MARKSSSDSGGFFFKTGIFALLAGAAFWLFNMFGGSKGVWWPSFIGRGMVIYLYVE